MSKITLSGRTIGSVKVTSTDRTTIVKSITVGTPIRSVVQAGSSFDGLSDVVISGASNNDFIQFDSSSQKFVNTSSPVFTTISSSLIPSADSTYDLGSAAAKWRDLYLSGSTLNLGGLAIKDQSGTFSVTDSIGTAVGFDLSGSQSQIRSFFSGAGDITYNSSTGEFSIDVEATYSKANFDSDFNTALDETALGGTGLTFDSASNTLSITNTGVDSAVYGSASKVPVLTVNARGQIDSAGTVNVAGVSSTSYDSATGVFTINTADGNSFATTFHDSDDRISEIRGALSAGGDLSYNSATGQFTFDVEQVYTKANFDSDLGDASTSNLPEGTNLYYTTVRADSAFDVRLATKSTSNLSEGSNLYYTTARADSDAKNAISGGTGITYNSTTGEITTTDGDIVHDNLSGFVANEHIDHSTVSVVAGKGLTGGGTIAANRTIDIDSANVRGMFSATDAGGDGSFSYNSGTGAFTYTGPSAAEVKAHFQPLDSSANPTFNQVRGPAEFIIDPAAIGDATGTVKILGNLQVEGTQTTINSTTVTLNDKNIVIGDSAADSSALNGGGITWGGSNIVDTPSLTYDHSNAEFDFNRTITSSGNRVLTTADEGSGNGLDADTLDNIQSSGFLRSNVEDAKTSGNLNFSDNVMATFGADSDLKIYHDGSNSYINDQGTGNLKVLSNTFQIMNAAENKNGLVVRQNAEAELYYNGVERFATTEGGVNVVGSLVADSATVTNLTLPDDGLINLGDNNDLRLDHTGSVSRIRSYTGELQITQNANDQDVSIRTDDGTGSTALYFKADGSEGKVRLYYYGTEKLTTESDGVTVTGSLIADSISLADNARIKLGDANDLQIYHNGSHSYIDEGGTGSLIFKTSQILFKNPADNEQMASFTANGDVKLRYDNVTRLETTEGGVTVTGSLVADSINLGDLNRLTFGAGEDLKIYHNNSSNINFIDGTGSTIIRGNWLYLRKSGSTENFLICKGDGAVEVYHDNSKKLETTAYGATVTGSLVSDSVSTGPLNLTGIVTQTTTSSTSNLTGTWRYERTPGQTNIELRPNAAYTGWHPNILMRSQQSGTAMYMLTNGNRVGIGQYDAGTGGTPRDMSAMITFQPSADSTPRLDIGDAGSVNGELGIGGNVILGDSLGFSTSELIQSTAAIELSGGVTYDPAGGGPDTANDVGIALTTGTRIIGADNGYIRTLLEWNQSNALEIGQSGTALINHTKIFGGTNGVELYESTAKKLETTPYGVTVTGTVNADSATISGNLTVDTNTLVVDAANNKVGINVASPQRSFHIVDQNVGVATTYGVAVVEATDAQFDLVSSSDGTWGSSINFVEGASTSANTDVWSIARKTTGGAGDGSLHFNFGTVNQHNNSNKMILSNSGDLTVVNDLTVDTNTLHVDAANNRVGIGLTAPTSPLTIKSSSVSSTSSGLSIQANSSTNDIVRIAEKSTNGGRFHMYDSGVEKIAFYTDGTDNHISAGNLGLGTTSPTEKFEVYPDTDISAVIGRAHIGYMGFSDIAGFSHVDKNSTNDYALIQNGSGQVWLNASSGQNMNFRINNGQKMTLSGSSFDIDVPVTIGAFGSYTLDGDSAEVASVSQTSIAEFAHASYCGAKFIVTASQGTKRQISELLVTHDGTTAVATEYGTITTDSDLATYDVDISGSDVRLLATGTSATSTRYKVVETLIEA